MNFFNPTSCLKKNNEDYNIIECSSQCEIEHEEIADTSSPECSEKKHSTSSLGFSSSNKKKFSVKRKIMLPKPVLDVHKTSSNLIVRTGESSAQYGVSIGLELQQCNYNPTCAALTAGLIKSPSPEIISKEDDIVELELYNPNDEIICSQESSCNISFEDEKQLSNKAMRESSDQAHYISNDHLEEIISSQDTIDIQINNDEGNESVQLNDQFSPVKTPQEEGHEGNLGEEIICSQDSLLGILEYNNKYIKKCVKSNESLLRVHQEEDIKDHLDVNISQEDIIYSQNSIENMSGMDNNMFEKPSVSPSKSPMAESKQDYIDIEQAGSSDGYYQRVQISPSLLNNSALTKISCEKSIFALSSMENDNHPISSGKITDISNNPETHESNSEFIVKAPKKGTLLQRAFRIVSDIKKEANLLYYEIQVGLRASHGIFVSEAFIINNIYFEDNNYILSITPHKERSEFKENIYLVISKLNMHMRINSVIVMHFPLIAVLVLPVMKIILFAEDKVQVIKASSITGPMDISLPNFIIGPNDHTHMCVISNNEMKKSKSVFNAIIDQILNTNFSTLELKLLHLFQQRTDNCIAIEYLAIDPENQFCIIKDLEYNLPKDLNLEINNSYIFSGFTLRCIQVENKVRSAAEYYSSIEFKNRFIFVLEPSKNLYQINHTTKPALNSRNFSVLKSTDKNFQDYERFEFLVKKCHVYENKIFIGDGFSSEMKEIQFSNLCCQLKEIASSSVPVLLRGVYFLNGFIQYDEYSQMIAS